MQLFSWMARYHRVEARALWRIPDGPCILVANHNGGLYPVDGLLAWAYYQHFGIADPLYILTHDIISRIPWISSLARRVGMVRAHETTADALLARNNKVLIFPGGDLDALRPFHLRDSIQLGGRNGFAKLAIRHQVPVVPIVSAGSHETMLVLRQGRRLARRMSLAKRARINCFPIALCLPWGLVVGPGCALPYVPLPAKVTIQVGEPMKPVGTRVSAEELCSQVQDTMQQMLQKLYSKRKRVFFG